MDIKQIYWLAGLLEGEGCFTFRSRNFGISLEMTDEDVVTKARNLMNSKSKIYVRKGRGENYKTQYIFHVSGMTAISWMQTLYPILGWRRKEKIREIIAKWKEYAPNTRQIGSDYCVQGHPLFGDNLVLVKHTNGKFYKACKICRNTSSLKWYEKDSLETKFERQARKMGLDPEMLNKMAEDLKNKKNIQ